jgi:hypothetical protein
MVLRDEWSKYNTGGPMWHIKDMCATVTFAAYRILERTFIDDGTEMFAKETEGMKLAIAQMNGITVEVNKHKEEDIDDHTISRLKMAIEDLYVASFSVLSAAIRTHGLHNLNEWMPTFQEYQTMLASAFRYIRK